MIKKRLALLLALLTLIIPNLSFAETGIEEVTVTVPQIEVNKIPFEITTDCNLNIVIDIPDSYPKDVWTYPGDFEFEFDGLKSNGHQYYLNYGNDDRYYLFFDGNRGTVCSKKDYFDDHLVFPITGTITKEKVTIKVTGHVKGAYRNICFNFSTYVQQTTSGGISTTPGAISTTPGCISTTPSVIQTTSGTFGGNDPNYFISSRNNSISNYNYSVPVKTNNSSKSFYQWLLKAFFRILFLNTKSFG